MLHRYPPARRALAIATDLLLLGIAIAIPLTRAGGSLSIVLSIAIPAVLAWGVLTLHNPRSVEIDDQGITFAAYGRAHRYAWSSVQVHVRRFLVRDRVLVRFTPSPPWRGRYWLLDALDGYDALVRQLEKKTSDRQPQRSE
jgi:hypothetical protein